MIPTLGLLIAVYCIARLIQVPIQDSRATKTAGSTALVIISALAILAIGSLALSLLSAGTSSTP